MINPPINNVPKVVQVLSQMGDLALKHLMLNRKSMDVTHIMGYNGFKRMHRCNTMKYNYFLNCVSCVSIDDFGKIAKIDNVDFDYAPTDLQSHLQAWADIMETDIKIMGSLSVQFFQETGVIFEPAKCFINDMFRQKEKINRYIKRFDETKSPHDYHVVDDKIHAKYKEKEGEYNYGY